MRLTSICGHKDVECMRKNVYRVYLPKSIEAPEWPRERVKGMDEEKILKLAQYACVCDASFFFSSFSIVPIAFVRHTHTSAKAKRNIHAIHTFLDSMIPTPNEGHTFQCIPCHVLHAEQQHGEAHAHTVHCFVQNSWVSDKSESVPSRTSVRISHTTLSLSLCRCRRSPLNKIK